MQLAGTHSTVYGLILCQDDWPGVLLLNETNAHDTNTVKSRDRVTKSNSLGIWPQVRKVRYCINTVNRYWSGRSGMRILKFLFLTFLVEGTERSNEWVSTSLSQEMLAWNFHAHAMHAPFIGSRCRQLVHRCFWLSARTIGMLWKKMCRWAILAAIS